MLYSAQVPEIFPHLVEHIRNILFIWRLLDITKLWGILSWDKTVIPDQCHTNIGHLIPLKMYLTSLISCTTYRKHFLTITLLLQMLWACMRTHIYILWFQVRDPIFDWSGNWSGRSQATCFLLFTGIFYNILVLRKRSIKVVKTSTTQYYQYIPIKTFTSISLILTWTMTLENENTLNKMP